jgi:cytochrome bd-type quinol oxidase subunit 2
VEDSPFYIMTCGQGGTLVRWASGLAVAHVLVLICSALILAHKTRNSMPSKYKSFRESYHIFLAVVNITFMMLLTAPVLLTTHDPFTTYTVCSLSFIFSSSSGVGIIFFPKVCGL